MKRIIFMRLPNNKIAKAVAFEYSEFISYTRIANKNHYYNWYKDFNNYDDLEKELLKND